MKLDETDELRNQLQAVQAELNTLQAEHQRLLTSTTYRLALLCAQAVRSPQRLLTLPVAVWRLWQERQARRKPANRAPLLEALRSRWQVLANQAVENQLPVVLLFSGTTCIQGVRGNRPIRQAQALLQAGAVVFFGYHRSRTDEPLASYEAPQLMQSPVDFTLELMPEFAATPLPGCPKLLVLSYPLPGTERFIALFRQHGWAVVYDCRDDWEEFAKVGMARWYKASSERYLVAHCDATLCVSAPLVSKMRGLAANADVRLMPNAVEQDYAPPGYVRRPVAPAVVGYFGHLSDAWFDWPALMDVAEQRPQYVFEIIGHSAPAGLKLPPNVQLLGPKPWNQLHEYAARWSAAIIPFRMGPLADGVDPIKIYEYLALQLPVVSFLMPQISHYPYTQTVATVADFCTALDAAVTSLPDAEGIAEFLSHNTWEVRAKQLLALAAPPGGQSNQGAVV